MTKKYDYDVLYIGAGHGTFDGAVPLAAKGFKIAVIEADKVGGTCPNWGCNAKITLDAPVELHHQQQHMSDLFDGPIPKVNWAKNMAHKHEVIDGLPDAIEGLVSGSGIDVIHGFAKLADAHTVIVNDEAKTADKIVLATGLHPHRLDVPGKELAHDSQEFLALDELPKRLTIIGSGYIGMEFADIANASGAEVTVLMAHDKALRGFYQPYVEEIVDAMAKRGVNFIKNAKTDSFEKTETGFAVHYNSSETVETDWILDATGRVPNVANMGLDEVGVKYDKHGIIVNEYLQTSVDNIYASGDVVSSHQPKLTPTAAFESQYLTKLFSRETTHPIEFPAVPSVTFTSPRIAQIGVSVEEAKQSDHYKVVESDLAKTSWYYQINKQPIAKRALVFDDNNQLVGATEMSERAEDVIDALVPVIELKPTREQLDRMIHLFPAVTFDVFSSL